MIKYLPYTPIISEISFGVNLGTVPSCITENPPVSPTILEKLILNLLRSSIYVNTSFPMFGSPISEENR